jgi:cyclopropane-fatty-acyl-phospholipid synthase
MTYSCAVFENESESLEKAQINKYERICNKLGIRPDHHLLEIGTGWGGFAVYAARTIGCKVTTTTISRQQFEYAFKKIRENGVEDRVTMLFEDYRELKGRYDRIVSIEMIEAVGHHYLNRFFKACGDLLKENGLLCLQAITIPDQVYSKHIRSVDFIKRYIFPGSFIPSVTAMCQAATAASDLRLVYLKDITAHYAKTLALWRKNFLANRQRVLEMGFSDEFVRMWEFYLCYCQGSFAQRYNGDAQMVFSKAKAQEPILP